MGEAIAEGDNAMGEVVLRQPGHHTVFLHIGSARYIHNQIARILPVPAEQSGSQLQVPGAGAGLRMSLVAAAPT